MTDKPTPTAAVLALIAAAKATTEIDGCGFAVKVNERTGANLVEVPFVAYVQLHEALAALPDLAELCVVPRDVVEGAAARLEYEPDYPSLSSSCNDALVAKLRECLA